LSRCSEPRQSLWRTLVPLTVFALANSSDAFLLLRAKGLGLSDPGVILAYLLFNLVYAASSCHLGVLSDRLGRWRMMIGGWGLYAGVYFTFASADSSLAWGLFPIYGLYMGLTEGVGKALVADHAPPARLGAAIGLLQMSLGLAALASSLCAGWLWDLFGPAAAFRFGGGMALIAIATALLLAPWRRRPA